MRTTLRLVLAAVLATVLAFRPYRFIRVVPRNPHVAQTQILLSVVASALMMIVGDNAARAFGISVSHISTDKLSQEIFEADAEFVDSIEWRQKKSSSYFYR